MSVSDLNFKFVVDAQSTNATGNFRVRVTYGDPANPGVSCCRMAVDNGDATTTLIAQSAVQPTGFRLYPNPAQHQLTIEASGEWEGYRVVDMQSRVVLEGNRFAGRTVLSTDLLNNGLYRFIAVGKAGTRSGSFQILK